MIIREGIFQLEDLQGSAVTVGKFDGLHLGHQRIIAEMVRASRKRALIPVVAAISAPGGKRIFTREEMAAILENLGAEIFLEIPFTDEFRNTDAETFLRRELCGQLRMKACFSGDDFRFGKDGAGDTAFLQREAEELGYEYRVIPDVSVDGEVVRSSLIREKLAAMDVRSAGQMLGRPYSISGTVAHGRRLGSRIGYPTVNVVPAESKFLPGFGVYAAELTVCREDGPEKTYQGVLDLGVKPTVEGSGVPAAEVHLFDFDGDLYGKRVNISFLQDVRAEKKFGSLTELRKQISEDVENVQQLFKL
jgi:riboflavin kinase/FMN adenylyltransferase